MNTDAITLAGVSWGHLLAGAAVMVALGATCIVLACILAGHEAGVPTRREVWTRIPCQVHGCDGTAAVVTRPDKTNKCHAMCNRCAQEYEATSIDPGGVTHA